MTAAKPAAPKPDAAITEIEKLGGFVSPIAQNDPHLEVSYHLNGSRQETKPGSGDRAYARAGVVPTPVFGRSGKRYPMLRYPWVDTRAALQAMAANQPDLDCVQVTYVNPETGDDAENILGFYALMLRPGQTLTLPARSPAQVFHLIEGGVDVSTCGKTFGLDQATFGKSPPQRRRCGGKSPFARIRGPSRGAF